MSKDMLGSVVRAAISVPQDRMDVLAKVASAMAADNPTGEAWHKCFKTQLKEGLSSPEPMLDFIVRVDRSVKPNYSDWFKKLENPELECSGPAEYDLSKEVDQWFHDGQKRGAVVGDIVYRHLQEGDALATCLNLQDGLAIQEKGVAVFRKLFAGKAVFLWGSVVQYLDDRLLVPYLYDNGDKVRLCWQWLDNYLNSNNPALRFRQVALWT